MEENPRKARPSCRKKKGAAAASKPELAEEDDVVFLGDNAPVSAVDCIDCDSEGQPESLDYTYRLSINVPSSQQCPALGFMSYFKF